MPLAETAECGCQDQIFLEIICNLADFGISDALYIASHLNTAFQNTESIGVIYSSQLLLENQTHEARNQSKQ